MLEEILNYQRIDDSLGSAGQPTAEQFAAIQDAGFGFVINLALPTSDGAIADEGRIVTTHGMSYTHIPVSFESPQEEDFHLFSHLMDSCADRPVFVHCAANKRVSAFIYLHRITQGGIPPEQAAKDLHAIWHPNETWARLIESIRGQWTGD